MTDVSTPGPPPYRKVVAMTSTTCTRLLLRARTGGPQDDDWGPKIVEHVLGWTLVVLLAVLVTRAGLM
ncbi:SCO1431 family membrane protein [Streptomyces sp. NPDC058326]|uniref:SCO1431 family membrane protein n=1 Tax=Streptomyces sp. NPDC058326 TaxID=3346447 RepID=UPI0036E31A50